MAEPIRLYEQKHQERYEIRTHHHAEYQILYAVEGSGTLTLDGERRELAQGGAAVLFPMTPHAVSSDTHLTLLVLEFDESLFQDDVAALWKERFVESSTLLRLSLFHAGELRQLLRKLLFEQRQEGPISRWAMRVYWLEVLLLLAQAKASVHISDANALRAERMRQYIDTRYFEPITANDLAYRLGVSSRRATAIFKEKYHMTPLQYLTDVRIGAAKKLLLETDKDVISIGFEVGYESLATFYRVFKSVMFMSPSKYRQTHRNE